MHSTGGRAKGRYAGHESALHVHVVYIRRAGVRACACGVRRGEWDSIE
jgi:hypothetical protein